MNKRFSFSSDDIWVGFTINSIDIEEISGENLTEEDYKIILKDYIIRGFDSKYEYDVYMKEKMYLQPLFNFDNVELQDFKKLNLDGVLKLFKGYDLLYKSYVDAFDRIMSFLEKDKYSKFYVLGGYEVEAKMCKDELNWYWVYFLIFWIKDGKVNIIEFFGD